MTGKRQAAETAGGASGGATTRTPTRKQPASGRGKARREPPRFVVDPGLCKSCGICIRLCPHGVFKADGEGRPVPVDPAACTRCRFCEQHCPDFALEILGGGRSEALPSSPPRVKGGASACAEDDEGDD